MESKPVNKVKFVIGKAPTPPARPGRKLGEIAMAIMNLKKGQYIELPIQARSRIYNVAEKVGWTVVTRKITPQKFRVWKKKEIPGWKPSSTSSVPLSL